MSSGINLTYRLMNVKRLGCIHWSHHSREKHILLSFAYFVFFLLYTCHKESNVDLGIYCHYHLVRFRMPIRCFGNLFLSYNVFTILLRFSPPPPPGLICLLSTSNQSCSYPTFTKTKKFDRIPGSGSTTCLMASEKTSFLRWFVQDFETTFSRRHQYPVLIVFPMNHYGAFL